MPERAKIQRAKGQRPRGQGLVCSITESTDPEQFRSRSREARRGPGEGEAETDRSCKISIRSSRRGLKETFTSSKESGTDAAGGPDGTGCGMGEHSRKI